MKKILFSIICSLILVLTLASCGNSQNTEKIRTVLNSLNSTNFDKNGLTITSKHKYDIASHTDDEYEKVDYSISYDGTNIVTTVIDGLTEDISNFTYYDLITTRVGYIRIQQIEKVNYDYKEEDKLDNEKAESKNNYEIDHDFIVKFDESTVYVSATSKYNDLIDSKKNVNETFNGKIAKSLFTESISKEGIDACTDRLLVMDSFETITSVQKYTTDFFLNTKKLNDGDFSNFVNKNQLAIEDSKDSSAISFTYPCDEFLATIFKTSPSSKAKITGKLIVDNNKKELTHFEYDLKDFMFNTLDGIDSENRVTPTINEYILTGDSFNSKSTDIKLEKEFKDFTDIDQFMDSLFKIMPAYFE